MSACVRLCKSVHKSPSHSHRYQMIIKSIFRRYERWNPVHPTNGAFWGIGIGIGCGVGWGPGFGPEVVGYVGAGCGVGFSVGITLLGLGIGLPANYLLQVPRSAFMVTTRGALDVARAGGLIGKRSREEDGWGDIGFHISDAQQNPWPTFPSIKFKNLTENIVDLPKMRTMMVSNAKHVTDQFQSVGQHFFSWNRGSGTDTKGDPSEGQP